MQVMPVDEFSFPEIDFNIVMSPDVLVADGVFSDTVVWILLYNILTNCEVQF